MLETRRLILRPLGRGDEALFCALYGDAATMRFIGRPLAPPRARTSFATALRAAGRPGGPQFFAIVTKAGGAVGMCALQAVERRARRVEGGIVLAPRAQGKGYAREAFAALAAAAFRTLPIDMLWVQYRGSNAAAGLLFSRLGFSPAAGGLPGGVRARRTETVRFIRKHAWNSSTANNQGGTRMSNIVSLLENIGSDASLRHATNEQLIVAMNRQGVAPALRAAILHQDRSGIDALIDRPFKVYCLLLTPKPKKAPERKPAKVPKKKPAKAPARKPGKGKSKR